MRTQTRSKYRYTTLEYQPWWDNVDEELIGSSILSRVGSLT